MSDNTHWKAAVDWSQTFDMRGVGNVKVAGVRNGYDGTVANCGSGPEGIAYARTIVVSVNAHAELVRALIDIRDSAAYCAASKARAALALAKLEELEHVHS